MPTRSRHGPSAGTDVADPTEDAPGQLRTLKFNQPLSWRVGRSAIPIADLLQRLQTLAHELRNLEQEEIETESLKKVSQELANGHLLAHKDKGVRAWATCCIVDVLRLCAPDAPFTGNQLKDIFTCIVSSIIPTLADPSNAYNAQHVYVLNSLAEVKSIVLMTDLDHPDTLIIPLFTTCFDIVSGSSKASTGEQIAKNVEFDMTRMLVTIIDESPVLAPEVVDVIVAQFLRVDPRALEPPTSNKRGKRTDAPVDMKQDTLLLKDYPPAYNMAKAICQACPERMTSHISQYFNNVIVDSSAQPTRPRNSHSSSKQSLKRAHPDDSDEETEDIKELAKAHRLIRELWRACPEVLQNVVPQLEAELSAESVPLRLLATQTIGDLTAGIGVSGPPPPPPMDPAKYPAVSLSDYAQSIPQPSALLAPLSPKPFSQVHASAYDNFLSRRQDKSASVRAAWATVAGRILSTSAGGCGLSHNEEQSLLKSIAYALRDADERVRVAAVDAVGSFGLSDIVHKLAADGGLSSPESILSFLAERVKDRKPLVREHAIKVLARMWGVAAGEIEQQNEQVVSPLKDAPSRILDAYYTNDTEVHVLVDRVLFELLLPISYPPISKPKKSSQSQKQKDSQGQGSDGDSETDVDRIRVRRILTLLACLDERAKKVFFAMQHRQLSMRNVITLYLEHCEAYNGGVMDENESRIKSELGSIINSLIKMFPDPTRASTDLWKFAKVHDRRSYQLIRFAMAANCDYRTVTKAIKELARRAQGSNNTPLLDTLTPLLYRCSSLVFNKSHIPAIMSISRSNEHGLANAAHELLKEISSRNPEVLEAQVQEMCRDLEAQAPKDATTGASTTPTTLDASTEEILKACSGFAKRLPSKLPKERKFLQALVDYALYSPSPRAAKHAVSILMVAADRKEMYARDLAHDCVENWTYGSDYFLTRLAALSQLNLLAPREADEKSDAIISVAVNQILLANRSPAPGSGYTWSEDADDETAAKEWALKIIVNRLRAKGGSDSDYDFRAHANPVYNTLVKLVVQDGELSKKQDTPATQKSRLRLLAARLLLKLCASRDLCEQLFTAENFNSISLVAQDPLLPVRSGFIEQLIKNLMMQRNHLSVRWYTIPFLLAFEPNARLKNSTFTWLRARATFFSQQKAQLNSRNGEQPQQTIIMESVFPRLLSLLAYHPDYPSDELDEQTKNNDLADLARYILFYLSAIANEHNLSLIFHFAQRVKQARDGITKSDQITTHLHTLSDLAQATIRRFADIYSQQHKFGGSGTGAAGGTNILQTYPGRLGIPSSIFAAMETHREAQEVAEKNFLPEDVDENLLDGIVRSTMKPAGGQTRKRKSTQTEPKTKTNGATTTTTTSTSTSLTTGTSKNNNNNNNTKRSKRDGENEKSTVSRRTRKQPSSTTTTAAGAATRQKRRKKSNNPNEDDWSGDDDDARGGRGAGRAKKNRDDNTTTTADTSSRRRSSRGTGKKGISYADPDSDEDDIEMREWDQQGEDENENENENEGEKKEESGDGDSADDGDDDDDDEQRQRQGDDGEKEGEKTPTNQRQQQQQDNKSTAKSPNSSTKTQVAVRVEVRTPTRRTGK